MSTATPTSSSGDVRVLHVLDHSIPLQSGYTFRTLGLLREQRKRGWQTFHITSPKQGEGLGDRASQALEEDIEGWHFFRTPTAPGAKVGPWRVMRELEARLQVVAEQVRPHLIHTHSPVLNAWPALRVGRRLGIPVVHEIRGFWEDAAVDHGTTQEGSLRYRLSRAFETLAMRRADHVFTICEGLRADILGRGIAASKVTVIPNGVDIEAFEVGGQAEPELARELGLEGATVLGFVGSFYAYEGLDLLLDAMPRLLKERPDLRVLLVGGGPQDKALREQAKALGIDKQVVFTGRVPHAQVERYYNLIDLLTYPRHSMRLTELVTPLKPMEAMAQGRILIASDVGGHRELIQPGRTGELFKAGDANALAETVLGMLARRDSWPAMRAAGRNFVETERNWARSVTNYVEPYGRLLGA